MRTAMSRFSPPAVLGLRLWRNGRERQTSRRVDVGCFLGTDQDPQKGNQPPPSARQNAQQLQRLHDGKRFRFARSPHARAGVRRRREVGNENS